MNVWVKASKYNREYQQALISIKESIVDISKSTADAIVAAENKAFEFEEFIGKEFRVPKPLHIKPCKHKNSCIHFEQ